MRYLLGTNGHRDSSRSLHALGESPIVRCDLQWWQTTVLALGCISGCASWDQVSDNAMQPIRTTGNLLARTGDHVGDLFESNSSRHRNPANLPTHQELARRSASPVATAVKPSTATAQAGAALPTVSQPKAMQAIHNAPAANARTRESLSVPTAPPATELLPTPPAVELLPAPPVDVRQISGTRPSSPSPVTLKSEISVWCRIRVKNISQQTAPQVAVTVNSPEDVTLVSKDGDSVSAPTKGKMAFAPVAQVGPSEEVILVIGLDALEQQGNRLRVQVRDALGGSNQDVQARWNVTIEALE